MKKLVLVVVIVTLFTGVVLAEKKKPDIEVYPSVEINAPAEKVWAVLLDPNNWAHDNPIVIKSKLVNGDGEKIGSQIKVILLVGRKRVPQKLTVSNSEKNKKLEYNVKIPLANAVMGFTLEEKNGVTKLTSYEIASGLATKFTSQEEMYNEHLEWAKAIKKRVENK